MGFLAGVLVVGAIIGGMMAFEAFDDKDVVRGTILTIITLGVVAGLIFIQPLREALG